LDITPGQNNTSVAVKGAAVLQNAMEKLQIQGQKGSKWRLSRVRREKKGRSGGVSSREQRRDKDLAGREHLAVKVV
jgi:hypothetical protein